ncbi:MAG: dephospho-CoA kinase [Candidatus Latescibacterota bacterium]|nr:dephospho-CoA kinase [Candidatus Latescibacterota bacterium]
MILGVTGGMGVGKSALSRYLVALGARSLDADKVAHDLLEAGADRVSLRKSFGADIEDQNGQLDRRLLGRRALASKNSLQKLYAIVRPSLEAELRSRLGNLSKESPPNIVVFDAPLLYEWGIEAWTDFVVVVYADRETRIERIMRRSGLSRIEIERRMALQMDEEEKRERADFTVNNSGDLNALHQQAASLWAQISGDHL